MADPFVWVAQCQWYMEGTELIGCAQTLTAAKRLVKEWRQDTNKGKPVTLNWKHEVSKYTNHHEADDPASTYTSYIITKEKVFRTVDFK